VRDALGSVQSVLVIGGTSEIALATSPPARRRPHAHGRARGARAARARPRSPPLASCAPRARRSTSWPSTSTRRRRTPGPVDAAFAAHGDLDVVLVAAGILGRRDDEQLADAGALMRTNAAGAVSVLAAAAHRLRAQGHGTVVVLSSVAADRPRRPNYAYGASKTALDAFARGLAEDLHGSGVDVLIVRPGFVRTRMTAHLPDAPLAVGPDDVAAAIVDGLRRRAYVVYVPAPMRAVALVLRVLPARLARRLPF
jgi:decaprenylphospho-beta-D-erythro-pentofuranosid-2-ulose 2-reductase